LPGVALEVERIGVLVLLRRVLGVLDRAIGPVAEPAGVLTDIGMIRRALQSEVECNLQTEVAGRSDQPVEVG
jgi:hypothetical protein